MMESQSSGAKEPVFSWSPLTAKQRRVLGVLMEKSKTTPDAYPMTFTGLTTGCNQKTNRSPITNFTSDQVEKTVDELRALGALTLLQGNGRVDKVRHCAYQWLGLSKTEAAVMTELLLRGEQTVGELRTRASRMEPIADLSSLTPLIEALVARNLMVMLTPSGRGQLVSHNLYPEWELTQLQKQVAEGAYVTDEDVDEPSSESQATKPASLPKQITPSHAGEIESDRNLLQQMKTQLNQLAARVDHLERELGVETPQSN